MVRQCVMTRKWSSFRLVMVFAMLLGASPSHAEWSAPVPLAPSGPGIETLPEYRWSPIPGASWYQLWVNDATGTPVNHWYTAAQVDATSGECRVTPEEMLSAGPATWWVRAWNAEQGGGPWSEAIEFTVASPLTAPSLLSPAGSIDELSPTYRWSPVSSATWYQLWVNDSAGTAIVHWYMASQVGASSGECSVTPEVPLVPGSGTWWVRAWNSSEGSGPWSPGLTFTVAGGLPAPVPISPSGSISDSTPEYRWGAVDGATWYRLEVTDSAGPVVDRWYEADEVDAGGGECAVTPPAPLVFGEYAWRVTAWNIAGGAGPTSDAMDFQFTVVLHPPTPLSPDGTTVDDTPLYRWMPVPGATWYQLWVDDSNGNAVNRWYTASEVQASSGECAAFPQQVLAAGEATWWVRAWNESQGSTAWSVGMPFTVGENDLEWLTVLEFAPDPSVVVDGELRERIVATGLPWRVQDDASGIEMLLIPPGTFLMGCSVSASEACLESEFPVHEVTITRPFYLGRYEVTQSQWAAVMGSNPSWFVGFPDSASRPVERVSWNMIQEFEAMTGLRLPTEAEWEYACRAETSTVYNLPPDGTDSTAMLTELAWFEGNNGFGGSPEYGTKQVGLKQANNLGLHDMHGNVFEACEDRYSSGYYAVSPPFDPPGPAQGGFRVVRGGSWVGMASLCRSSDRDFYAPSSQNFTDGFRVARTP